MSSVETTPFKLASDATLERLGISKIANLDDSRIHTLPSVSL